MMNAGGKKTTSSLPVGPHGDQEEENGVQAPAHRSAFPEANQVAGRRQKPLFFSLQATSWLLPRLFGLEIWGGQEEGGGASRAQRAED